MTDSATGNKPKPKNNKRRNNNRRRNHNKKPGNANNKAVKADGANKPTNPNKKNYSKNRRPKSLTPSRIMQKYDNLMEQYITARGKFYNMFGRNSQKQLAKTEKNYQTSLHNLRKYEVTLQEDWQREVLQNKINGLPEDLQYSTEHNLDRKGDVVSHLGEFDDIHLLPDQKSENWSEDTEESQGTIEDYRRYKDGYTPQ